MAAWGAEEQQRMMGKHDSVGEPKTVEGRAWRNTKPVLHLAVALNLHTAGASATERQAKFAALFLEKSQVVKMLEFAETLRSGMPGVFESQGLQLTESETIKVLISA